MEKFWNTVGLIALGLFIGLSIGIFVYAPVEVKIIMLYIVVGVFATASGGLFAAVIGMSIYEAGQDSYSRPRK